MFNHLKHKLILEKAIIFACFGIFIAVFVYGWPVWSDTRSIASKMPWLKDSSYVGIVLAGLISPSDNDMDTISISRKLAASPLRDKYRQEGAAFVLPAKEEGGVAVKIGSTDGNEFSPIMTIERWDGDVKMKIIPKLTEEDDTETNVGIISNIITDFVSGTIKDSPGDAVVSSTESVATSTAPSDEGDDQDFASSSSSDSNVSSEPPSSPPSADDSGDPSDVSETSGATENISEISAPTEEVAITEYASGTESDPIDLVLPQDDSTVDSTVDPVVATSVFSEILPPADPDAADSREPDRRSLFIDKDELGDEKVIKYETPESQYIFYDTTVSNSNESDGAMTGDGEETDGYEFEFTLKQKPDNNVFEFDIETENLDFFYQPPLNVEMSDPNCTATDCQGAHRPINVVGSYEVYYKNGLSGDYTAIGGKNYGTGKAFQIYRPRAYDADGNYAWCELYIDELAGKMTITVPEQFLQTAKYPLIVDPTFGYTSIGGSYQTMSASYIYGTGFDSGGSGVIVTTTAYLQPGSTSAQVSYGIYATSTLAVVASTTSKTPGSTTAAWYSYALQKKTGVASSTYWLLVNGNNASNRFYYTTTGAKTNQSFSKSQTFGTWPATISSPTYATRIYSIYATYEPGIGITLGKTTDGWGGAIPIYLRLYGISSSTYSYARASTTNPSGVTSYTDLTWNSATSAFFGVIYPGSNYCDGCVDPATGTFKVAGQVSSSSAFSGIDYTSATSSFITIITRRWNAVSTASMGYGTEFNPTWSTDHWAYTIHDFSVNAAATYSNVAIAIPFLPTSSVISNIAVTYDSVSLSQGSAASTSDCWWWDDDHHTLYVQDNSLGTTYKTINLTFNSDTDLWATRFDRLDTANIGERLFYNGVVMGNKFINAPIFGGGFEGSGEQVEISCRDASDNDRNLDCMERAAVHVGGTIRTDASSYYSADIKWKQEEWASMITYQDNNRIEITVHSDSTTGSGWQQQLATGISATRVQNFYANKRYIKNYYTFTNNSSTAYSFPFVWTREQWLAEDRSTSDKGLFYGDASYRTMELGLPMASFAHKWLTSYDSGATIAMGVLFESSTPADMGYFTAHPVLSNASPWAEWPIATTSKATTPNPQEAADTIFTKTWSSVPVSGTATMTFWQWGYCSTSLGAITSTIDNDYNELNTSTPAVVSVTVSDGAVTYGTMSAGTSKSTIDLSDAQTVTNNGGVAEDFSIKGQDGSGGGCTWTLGSSAGTDQYVHSYCNATDLTCTSPPTNYTAASTTYQTLDTSVPSSSTTSLQLRLTAPNISSCFGEQDVDMTIMAAQS